MSSQPLPEFLYKFTPALARSGNEEERRTRQERYDRLLTHNALYFSPPRDFNDPMDSKPYFSFTGGSPEQLERLRRRTLFQIALRDFPELQGRSGLIPKVLELQEIYPKVGDEGFMDFIQDAVAAYVRDVGILCLSETSQCPVMYYHYADAHRGMCLKFRTSLDYFASSEQVEYSKQHPEIDYFSDDDGTEFKRLFLTKYESWSYEKEWRIVDFSSTYSAGKSRFPLYPSELLEGVIFGYLMPREDRLRIVRLLNDAGRAVPFFEAKLQAKSYELEVLEWAPDYFNN